MMMLIFKLVDGDVVICIVVFSGDVEVFFLEKVELFICFCIDLELDWF